MSRRKRGFKEMNELHLYHSQTQKKFIQTLEEGRRCAEELAEKNKFLPSEGSWYENQGGGDLVVVGKTHGCHDSKACDSDDASPENEKICSSLCSASETYGQELIEHEPLLDDLQELNSNEAENLPEGSRKLQEARSVEHSFKKRKIDNQESYNQDSSQSKTNPKPPVTNETRTRSIILPSSLIGNEESSVSTMKYIPAETDTFSEDQFRRGLAEDKQQDSFLDLGLEAGEVGNVLDASKYSKKFSDSLDLVIFPASDVSVKDVLNMTQAIYLRYNIPKEARYAILEMIKVLAGPEFKNLNLSKYYISKFNKPTEDHKTYTFYCTACSQILSKPLPKKFLNKNSSVRCDDCEMVYKLSGQEKNFYINMDVEYQLRSLLNNRVVWEALLKSVSNIKRNQNTTPKEITDIHDAELYKNTKHPHEDKEEVIVLKASVNLDGAAMHQTTKFSLWPILLLISELPQKLRFKMILLAAALLTSKEPNFHLMNSYVGSFLEQMDKLMNRGMLFFDKIQRKSYRIFVIPLIFAVDTVARPILQARKQYNAHYGCSWCYAYGEKIGSMRYLKKHYAPDQSQQEYLKDLKKREHVKKDKNGEKVYRGVRGKSRIAEYLPYLDNIWAYPPEYMHGVLLGVSKQFWEFLNKSSCRYKLSPRDLKLIDERLTSFTPIKSMYRRPCELKKKGKWKAADWLYWLVFYSIPCFRGILDNDVFVSYSLFVNSIRLLMSSKIDEEILRQCDRDLRKFVEDCEEFFGPEFMTFNVHSLIHLVQSVRKTGPLWASSAFPFESGIGRLKEFVTGTTDVLEQITDHVLELNEFTNKVLTNPSEHKSIEFCKQTMSSEHTVMTYHRSTEDAIVPYYNEELSSNQYKRCIFKNTVLHSASYTRPELTDDTFIRLSNGDVVEILYFYLEDNNCHARVRDVDVSQVNLSGNVVDHMFVVTGRSSEDRCISICEFESKMVHLDVMDDLEYVCSVFDVFDAQ